MIEFGEEQFRDLCRGGSVQLEIETIEHKRRAALMRFWLFLFVGAVAGALLGYGMIMSGAASFGFFVGCVVFIGAILLASRPLRRIGSDLKQPVLERLAAQSGMTYAASGFTPPVYEEARPMLFGNWLSDQSFTDHFAGTDAEGRRFALYEATLARSSGKSRHVVFTGQIYAFERRARSGAPIAVLPDRSLFNFIRPDKAMERVAFDGDPEFEKKFEAYAAHPHEALLLLGSDARRLLLEARRAGKVFVYVGPGDVLVGISGRNMFEAGSMFRARSGEERVRAMFDDLGGALALLARLRASLG